MNNENTEKPEDYFRTEGRQQKILNALSTLTGFLSDDEIKFTENQPKNLFMKRNCMLIEKLCHGNGNYLSFYVTCPALSVAEVEKIKLQMYEFLFSKFNTNFKKFQDPIVDLGIYRRLLGVPRG